MVTRLTLLLAVFLLPAAATAGGQRLTLDEAIAATLENNPDLRAARAAEREGAARVAEARAAYLPRVDLVEAWQRGNNPVYVFGSLLSQQRFTAANFALDALNDPDAVTSHRAAVSIDQPLFDTARLSGIRAAGLGRLVASLSAREAAADLALAATRAYGDALRAGTSQAAAAAAVAAAKEDLARAERSRDVGMGTESDVLSLRVHLAQMQERDIQATSGVTIATAQLNRLMGTPLDHEVILAEPAPATVTVPSREAAEQAAVRDRPAFQRAAVQQSLAETARRAAGAAFLPQVYVQGLYEVNGHTFTDRASSWMVAGQVRWNLFAGGGDLARLRAATESAARAAAERQSAEAGLRLEAWTTRSQLEAAVAREAVGRSAVLQARESQRIIRDRYDAGLASVNDVLRAANALLDAETLRISSIVDVMVAKAALDRATGTTRN
jgi:outer membrane protein TolC